MTYIRCAFFIGIAATVAAGQSRDFNQLDAYLTGVAAQIPTGFEVAIMENGQQIYWKQFGPWTKDKQAKIASATKWLSGALVMSLVDDGILSLDDRASKYLPYMTGEKADITIRQLMSHTAGFPGEFPVVDPCLDDPTDTLDHCAQALAKVPLQAPPGTAFIYAGADMQIAGRVAESPRARTGRRCSANASPPRWDSRLPITNIRGPQRIRGFPAAAAPTSPTT